MSHTHASQSKVHICNFRRLCDNYRIFTEKVLKSIGFMPAKIFYSAEYFIVHFSTVAQCIFPDWGDKVAYGIGLSIGLSHRSVRLHRLAGGYDNPML